MSVQFFYLSKNVYPQSTYGTVHLILNVSLAVCSNFIFGKNQKNKTLYFSPALRRRSFVDDHRCVHRDWPLSVPSPAAPRRLVCCGRGRPGARLCAAPSSAVLSSALRFSTRRRPRHCPASCRAGFPSACTKNSV